MHQAQLYRCALSFECFLLMHQHRNGSYPNNSSLTNGSSNKTSTSTKKHTPLNKNKSKLKIILRDKWIYYNGKASPETYKENPFDLKILKGDLQKFIEADDDIRTQVLRIEYFETVINYIDGILRQINSRTYHIKNALEHRRFEAGF